MSKSKRNCNIPASKKVSIPDTHFQVSILNPPGSFISSGNAVQRNLNNITSLSLDFLCYDYPLDYLNFLVTSSRKFESVVLDSVIVTNSQISITEFALDRNPDIEDQDATDFFIVYYNGPPRSNISENWKTTINLILS
jgi:hypothetical protein